MELVSVIVTVFNAESKIMRCLESIALQSYKNIELVIFDDGSTDGTRKFILEFINSHVQLNCKFNFTDINIGRSSALNQCLEIVNGTYIAVMDADDVMYPDRISRQVAYLTENPIITIVGGAQLMFMENGSKRINRPPLRDAMIKAGLFVRTTMLHPTIMMRKKFLDRNNIRYNPEYYLCEDYKIFIDMLYAGAKFANLKEVVNTYDYTNKKSWDKYENRMILALNKIWGENLKILSFTSKDQNIDYFLKLTSKVSMCGLVDVYRVSIYFLKCTIYSKSIFGGKLYFFYMRIKDIVKAGL